MTDFIKRSFTQEFNNIQWSNNRFFRANITHYRFQIWIMTVFILFITARIQFIVSLRIGTFWISTEHFMVHPGKLGTNWHLLELVKLIRSTSSNLSIWRRHGIRKYCLLSKHIHEVIICHSRVAKDSWTLTCISLQLLRIEFVCLFGLESSCW